ncbi:DUF3892 domain-containing protein [Clostridium thermobutyricum]|nr:DUF3892 domain-containing protein [Clostridium thermobutyricum]
MEVFFMKNSKTQKSSNLESVTKVMTKDGRYASGYELSNGEVVSVDEAVRMAKNGEIKDVVVSVTRNGDEYLRSTPDDDESNNLSNLPHEKEY